MTDSRHHRQRLNFMVQLEERCRRFTTANMRVGGVKDVQSIVDHEQTPDGGETKCRQ